MVIPILKLKTIPSQLLKLARENNRLKAVFLSPPLIKGGLVIVIVLSFLFLSQAIEGSFNNFPVEEEKEIVKKGSFVYASQYLNPGELIIEEAYTNGEFLENQNIVLQDSAFLAVSCPSPIVSLGDSRTGIITYEVQPGDVPSEIAAGFGISTNTLLWANNLSVWDYIKPGQNLVILPVSGVLHKVKKNETIDQIVKKYKGDLQKTIEFNGLPASGALVIDQEVIIPDGQKPTYIQSQPRSYATYQSFPRPYADQSHKFPWGQCTWYVAQRRYIPWGGNAKTWIYQAPQYGFATGNEPRVGAIIATREGGYYGHVAYVEAVNGDYVTISEMSLGRGVKTIRTLHEDDWRIIGYIY